MGTAPADNTLESRLAAIEREIIGAARPANCRQLHDVVRQGDGELRIGPLSVHSLSLSQTLNGCAHAFLFAATLGTEVDSLMRRYSLTSPTDLLIAQAVSTALIESYCDDCEREMMDETHGEKPRMRFSPGYGDLSINTQRFLLNAIDAWKRIGIALTEGEQMIPTKSVSAIIGFANKEN